MKTALPMFNPTLQGHPSPCSGHGHGADAGCAWHRSSAAFGGFGAALRAPAAQHGPCSASPCTSHKPPELLSCQSPCRANPSPRHGQSRRTPRAKGGDPNPGRATPATAFHGSVQPPQTHNAQRGAVQGAEGWGSLHPIPAASLHPYTIPAAPLPCPAGGNGAGGAGSGAAGLYKAGRHWARGNGCWRAPPMAPLFAGARRCRGRR